MSKIDQIQNKIRELSGEAFQKLSDAYLHKRGYGRINPLGSVIDADKVNKGTPENLFSNKNFVAAGFESPPLTFGLTFPRLLCYSLR